MSAAANKQESDAKMKGVITGETHTSGDGLSLKRLPEAAEAGEDVKRPFLPLKIVAVGSVICLCLVSLLYSERQKFSTRSKVIEDEYERFLVLREMLQEGDGATCKSLLGNLRGEPNLKEGRECSNKLGQADRADKDTSTDTNDSVLAQVASIGIIFSGCLILGGFALQEYKIAVDKINSSSGGYTCTVGDIVSYRLDYYFSSSKSAKPLLLLAVTFVLIVTSAVGFAFVSGEGLSSALWRSWTYVADPGTHADAEGMGVRLVAFSATIGGMCVFALMIGIISDTIGEKVDELKKGKSRVIEKGHTLLLGWTDMSLPIIQEIALANESEGGGVIVVLSKIDKDEMEAELAAAKSSHESPLDLKGTKVLFRSGNTLAEPDLFKASAHTARAIVALSDGFDPDEADSRMVRQVLSLRSILQRNPQGGDGVTLAHVVCELRDVDNEHLIKMVGKDMVETVCAHDIIGRIMIQCARATGLAYILENLIGFDGHEFYLKEWPKLHRKAFGQLLTRFDDAVPVGIKHNGKVILSPSDDYIIQKGDEILVLAEDDDSYDVNDGSFEVDVKVGLPKAADKHEAKPEVLLFCGWRRDLADMIKDLDESVPRDSRLWLLNSKPAQQRAELLLDKGNKAELTLENLSIVHAVGNHYSRRDLKSIQAVSEVDGSKIEGEVLSLHEFDSILILAEDGGEDGDGPSSMEASDSQSLASLLLVKDLQREIRESDPRYSDGTLKLCQPISEILDTRTRGLLMDVEGVGYVLSNQIVSAAIAQVAENRDMNQVLGEMLRAEGCEVHVEAITSYLDPSKGKRFSFWDVYRLARKRLHDTPEGPKGEIAIGFKPYDVSWTNCADTILNPADKKTKRLWDAKDLLIVIAP